MSNIFSTGYRTFDDPETKPAALKKLGKKNPKSLIIELENAERAWLDYYKHDGREDDLEHAKSTRKDILWARKNLLKKKMAMA